MNNIELAWVRYDKDGVNKYMLMLDIGRKDNKFVGLVANSVPDSVVKSILNHKVELNDLPLDERIRWIRDRFDGYSSAYREIDINKITVEKTYKIGVK